MQARWLGAIALVAVLAGLMAACNSTTSPSTVASVVVAGTPPAAGSNAQFSAMATLSDGTTQDVTSTSTWTSSNTAVATVSSTGVVSGVADGSVNVTATYQSVAGVDQIALTN